MHDEVERWLERLSDTEFMHVAFYREPNEVRRATNEMERCVREHDADG